MNKISDYRESLNTIPESWKLCRFKDVYLSKKEIVGDRVNEYERLALTLKGVIKRSKEDDKGLQPADFETYQILTKNDMVFKMIDLQNISTSRVGRTPWDGLVSPAYLRFSPKYEDCGFMYYYFMSLYYRNVFNNIAGDGVRSALNSTDIGNIVCPFPSVTEQQKIVEALDKKVSQIDKLITNQEKQIAKLKDYKQSFITKVVTKGLNSSVMMKDSGVEWIDRIPNTWNVYPIKYLFSLSKGLPITKENLIEEGVKVISYGQLHAKNNISVSVDKNLYRFVSEEYLETYPECLVAVDDMIMADTSEDLDGTCDFVRINENDKIFAGYHSIILKNKLGMNTEYLAYLFTTDAWRKQFRSRVNGVKLFSLTQKILNQGSVILPSEKEQKKIVNYINAKCSNIYRLIQIKQSKIKELQEYKKSIIYEYVTGKKEVC